MFGVTALLAGNSIGEYLILPRSGVWLRLAVKGTGENLCCGNTLLVSSSSSESSDSLSLTSMFSLHISSSEPISSSSDSLIPSLVPCSNVMCLLFDTGGFVGGLVLSSNSEHI